MLPLQQGVSINPEQYISPLVSAVTTVVLFVVAFALIYWIGKSFMSQTVERGLEHRDFDQTLIDLAVSTTGVVVAVVAVALAATVAGFGVVLAAFATLAGALALAIGFAAQDLIENFVAGVFIIQDKPFTTGDWIEWDGNSGVVREVQLRVTKLDTFDNQLVTVPNSDLADAALINNEANDERRISVDFGIGYDDDIKQARKAIIDEAKRMDGVLTDPVPTAPVTELGDSAVVLQGRIWIDTDESSYGPVRARFIEAVKERFDEEGLDMPYPNTELTGDITVSNTSTIETTADD
ncbi:MULTISPECIES: mechanosensitive ion channel family protein [Saliphagus]|uniref:Mechanosensitive ion channel family protein n=1 Tax=Saliphagus infecundisoli TaxID=1849069 RepID=A0ABD5Q960_9EURY|nr:MULTISPECIES: mechanosensitive ion channel family protein [Saliphagus]